MPSGRNLYARKNFSLASGVGEATFQPALAGKGILQAG